MGVAASMRLSSIGSTMPPGARAAHRACTSASETVSSFAMRMRPLPTATGVFGMRRTTGSVTPLSESIALTLAIGVPAAIETITLSPVRAGAISATARFSTCGLTQRKM